MNLGTLYEKIELTGMLVPCNRIVNDHYCKYKLETDSRDYFLSMSESLELIAKKIEWDEVSVKGFLNKEANLVLVEKISLANNIEPIRFSASSVDSFFELDQYKRRIDQIGKLDLAPDYLAS